MPYSAPLALFPTGTIVLVRHYANGQLQRREAIYLGPVPDGRKHRFAKYSDKLGRWIGYTAYEYHIVNEEELKRQSDLDTPHQRLAIRMEKQENAATRQQ